MPHVRARPGNAAAASGARAPLTLAGAWGGMAQWLACATALRALACSDAEQPPQTSAPMRASESEAPASEATALAESASPPPLSPLCLLAGADAVDREDVFTGIGFGYFVQTDTCRTQGLTSAMSDVQLRDWVTYLINYSHALFGCGLLFSPLPGGVDAFGLANTDAVGVPNPRLAADDAALLIDIYLESCTAELSIPSADLADLRGRLERAAAPRIEPGASARLSNCQ